MINITAKRVTLRAVEPEDIDLLYEWENDLSLWGVSGTTSPFSHHTLSMFIESQREDIFTARQMRLMICIDSGVAIGALDIFEFEPLHRRAGVGIMVAGKYQRCGYALDALLALEGYAKNILNIHQLWCGVEEDNEASLALFSKAKYKQIGAKKDWNYSPNGYKSEIMLQKIFE